MTSKSNVPAVTKFSRSIAVTYCDDVRLEMHNKMSFVGIYQSQMLVREFPARVLRLCVCVQPMLPKTLRFESAQIGVYRDDELLAQSDFAPPDEAWTSETLGYVGGVTSFIFETLELTSSTTFRVRMSFDDGEVIGGATLAVQEAGSTHDI